MALTNPIIATASADAVAVFDQNFNQVFPLARPVKATVKEEAKAMEHPLETGSTITDHRIIQPVEIELSMILNSADYRSVYQQIKKAFINADLLVIQTKAGVYDNQLIVNMPHEEDPENYDAIIVALTCRQAQFVQATFSTLPARAVKNPANQSTVDRGQIQSSASNRSSSILFGVFN